jgi:hypothetical protein
VGVGLDEGKCPFKSLTPFLFIIMKNPIGTGHDSAG